MARTARRARRERRRSGEDTLTPLDSCRQSGLETPLWRLHRLRLQREEILQELRALDAYEQVARWQWEWPALCAFVVRPCTGTVQKPCNLVGTVAWLLETTPTLFALTVNA